MWKWMIWALIWPGLAVAEDWQRLQEDADIVVALAERVLRYDALTTQRFGGAGDTQYFTERMSVGRWAARAGQYCSVWPPSDVWACYDVHVNGDRVRFTASDRSSSIGTYVE